MCVKFAREREADVVKLVCDRLANIDHYSEVSMHNSQLLVLQHINGKCIICFTIPSNFIALGTLSIFA